MFDCRNYNELVDWMDMVLVGWIRYNAKKYEGFQDMVDNIYVDAIPLVFSNYIGIFESFVRAARTSEDVWNIMKETLLKYDNTDFSLMVNRLYREFLKHCINGNIEKYKKIWSKYHGY